MHDKVHTAWVSMAVTAAATELTRRFRMADVLYGGEDPEDWVPEDGSVASDPLTLEEMDERWIQFYSDRIQAQIEAMLSEEG
jgi:hypothetical protein